MSDVAAVMSPAWKANVFKQSPGLGLTISYLQKRSHALAKEKGFYDEGEQRNFGEMLMLAVSELSEAMECYRESGMSAMYYKNEAGKPLGIASEIADCVIRLADLAEYLGFSLEDVIEDKHKYNTTRPYKHGKIC
jgi:NTP pyrophosphatase (non-canonical NTP hydrolase)